ncbi:MAG TPA: hypothetical protein VEK08_07105 [Planctomycetota bacterium]|nr:hypothetical protein [Planctomycetota bacterium]
MITTPKRGSPEYAEMKAAQKAQREREEAERSKRWKDGEFHASSLTLEELFQELGKQSVAHAVVLLKLDKDRRETIITDYGVNPVCMDVLMRLTSDQLEVVCSRTKASRFEEPAFQRYADHERPDHAAAYLLADLERRGLASFGVVMLDDGRILPAGNAIGLMGDALLSRLQSGYREEMQRRLQGAAE